MTTRPHRIKTGPVGEDERQRKREAIERGRADAAAGRVVDHDDVQRWVESWGGETSLTRSALKCR